jgi:hypothetical protein
MKIRMPLAAAGLAAATLSCGFAAAGQPPADAEPQMSAFSPAPEQAAKPAGRSRLRFRGNGPTCMCADGLSERDIRKAETAASPASPTQSTDH